nr:hypothetical protein [Tanacetum cinerariifolium]
MASVVRLANGRMAQSGGEVLRQWLRHWSKKDEWKRNDLLEPSRDRNARDDNKRTRIENAFATPTNPVRRENMGTVPKCTTYNFYHPPKAPCRTCFNCNRPRHLAKDCRVVPRNVNPINARNPTARACYECGSTDHFKAACPRLNQVQIPGGNHHNQVVVVNGSQGRGKREGFDVIIGMDMLSNHKAEILCHEKVVRIPLLDGLVVHVFTQGDDPISCLNMAMAFLLIVASLRFPSTNNQLRTSSNLRNQATIQHDRVIMQQVQGRQGQNYVGTRYKGNATSFEGNNARGHVRVVKCYNYQDEWHMARQCTQLKRPRIATCFKDKALLVEAQGSGQILDDEQLAFLADPGILDDQAAETTIPNNVAF